MSEGVREVCASMMCVGGEHIEIKVYQMNLRGDRFKASQGGGLQQVVELGSSYLQDAVGVLKVYAGLKRDLPS